MDDILKNEERFVLLLRQLYRQYGYLPYKMSRFEEYDLYAENRKFLVSQNVITFTDLNGRLMALKPDVMLSIAKNHRGGAENTEKVCYDEHVYRVPAHGGGFTEITQTGLECIGAVDGYICGEVIMLAARSLAQISENCVLDLNHMGFISGLLDEVPDEEYRYRLLKEICHKNAERVGEVCALSGADESVVKDLQSLTTMFGSPEECLPQLKKMCRNEKMAAACAELEVILGVLKAFKAADKVQMDFSLTNELEYYNGVIFNGFVDGVPSAVLTGGRYDNLMQKLGKDCGAIGFGIYLDLLERFGEREREYDVDTLILYEDESVTELLAPEMRRIAESGRSVRAQRECGSIRCRSLMKMTERGLVPVDANN
ncbi:MAG: ATP phosphoribosyltransferase regulatory subunit [Oscillospiraceae bacterium]|nr:ATP phosphoribosyltransferase regulatory subunit [Oscillospiraceae bacterium]